MTQTRAERLAQFSDEDLAYHEAGHAVIHHLQGGIVTRLSIERDDRQGTHVAPHPSPKDTPDPQRALRDRIAVLVAGEVASTIYGTPSQRVTTGGKADRDAAVRAAAELGIDEVAARAMIDAEWPRVRAQLEEPANWQLVEKTAQALVRQKELFADVFRASVVP